MSVPTGIAGGPSGVVTLRWVLGWTIVRVSGHSMEPALRDGDYAILRRRKPRGVVNLGDVVLVDHPRLGLIVKAVREKVGDDCVSLEGTSAASTSREDLGSVGIRSVLATLVWRVARPLPSSQRGHDG